MSVVPVDIFTHHQVEQTGQPAAAYLCGSQGCGQLVGGTTRAIAEHLKRHEILIDSDDSSTPCVWEGCAKILKKGSMPRHILAHFGVKVRCSVCRLVLCRNDVLNKHIRTRRVILRPLRYLMGLRQRSFSPQTSLLLIRSSFPTDSDFCYVGLVGSSSLGVEA